MIHGFLICLALAAIVGGLLFACAAWVKWLDDRHDRRTRADFPDLHRTAAGHAAWERHVARRGKP